MNVADVLDRAADLIDARGHWKGQYCEGGIHDYGAVCVLGAIRIAHHGKLYHACGDFTPAAVAFMRLFDGENGVAIAWNDHDARTAAEVTSTLRACAAVERARAAVAETVTA